MDRLVLEAQPVNLEERLIVTFEGHEVERVARMIRDGVPFVISRFAPNQKAKLAVGEFTAYSSTYAFQQLVVCPKSEEVVSPPITVGRSDREYRQRLTMKIDLQCRGSYDQIRATIDKMDAHELAAIEKFFTLIP